MMHSQYLRASCLWTTHLFDDDAQHDAHWRLAQVLRERPEQLLRSALRAQVVIITHAHNIRVHTLAQAHTHSHRQLRVLLAALPSRQTDTNTNDNARLSSERSTISTYTIIRSILRMIGPHEFVCTWLTRTEIC